MQKSLSDDACFCIIVSAILSPGPVSSDGFFLSHALH